MLVDVMLVEFSKHFTSSDKALDAKLKSYLVKTANFNGKPLAAVCGKRQTKGL